MPAARGPRWPLVVTSIGVLALLAGVGRLSWVWMRQDAGAADQEASVLAFVLAAGGAIVALVGWAIQRHRESTLPATAEQAGNAAATLAGLVTEQWDREAEARGLSDPEPMPVRWRLAGSTLMDDPAVISPAEPLTFAETSTDLGRLAAAFRALPRRRLVVTGGPGTGKTTLAVQLLRELLAHPEADDRVPVLFSLATWDPDVRPQVQGWLAAQLDEMYPSLRAISPHVSAALVERNLVLPVLDGLDEVPADRRPAIVAALNPYPHGVVLTSRRLEYREVIDRTREVLRTAAVIAPLALTPDEAASYLARSLPHRGSEPWTDVLTALRAGDARSLAAVAATPLGLWLVRTVYLSGPVPGRPDPAPLADGTFGVEAELRDHLLEQLVPAAVRAAVGSTRRGRRVPSYDPDDVRRWLTTLAEQLRTTRTPDWQWWRMADHSLSTRPGRSFERGAVGMVGALWFGLAEGIVLRSSFVLIFIVGGAVAFGSLGRLLTRPATASSDVADRPVVDRRRTPLRTAAFGVAIGAVLGLASGAAFQQTTPWALLLAVRLVDGPEAAIGPAEFGVGLGVFWGWTFGLVGCLAFALRDLFGRPAESDDPGPSRSGRRLRDLARSVVPNLLVILLPVALFGQRTGFLPGLGIGLTCGLLYGLLATVPSRVGTTVVVVLLLGLPFCLLLKPLWGLQVALLPAVVFGVRRLLARSALVDPRPARPADRHDALGRTTAIVAVMLAAGFTFGLTSIWDLGPVFALSFALTVGSGGLARGLRIGLVVGMCVAVAGVLAAGLSIASPDAAVVGLSVGAGLGFVYGTAFGLRIFFGRRAPGKGAISPSDSYRRNVRRSVVVDAGLLLLAIAMGALLAAVMPGSPPGGFGPLDTALLLVAFGLLGGLTGTLSEAWSGFTIAACWEYLHRRLPAPWRVMTVLDDCYRMQLLRTVGPVYQFRHRQLQVHLAPVPATPSPVEHPSTEDRTAGERT